MVYPFERAAINGAEMPDGLGFPEQYLFLSLRCLYASVRGGTISKEQARREKIKLEAQYDSMLANANVYAHSTRMWREIEAAGIAYRKKKCIENADAFMAAVYGVYPKKEAL